MLGTQQRHLSERQLYVPVSTGFSGTVLQCGVHWKLEPDLSSDTDSKASVSPGGVRCVPPGGEQPETGSQPRNEGALWEFPTQPLRIWLSIPTVF